MRAHLLAAALLAGAAAPAEAAHVARLDTGEGKVATMRWETVGGVVRWSLTCLDESDPKGRPPDMATYRGVSKLEDGFLEGTVKDAPIPGRFVLAWRGLAPYWQLWLDACPERGGSPVIREVR